MVAASQTSVITPWCLIESRRSLLLIVIAGLLSRPRQVLLILDFLDQVRPAAGGGLRLGKRAKASALTAADQGRNRVAPGGAISSGAPQRSRARRSQPSGTPANSGKPAVTGHSAAG